MPRIRILAVDNCMHSSVTGTLDILTVAGFEWQARHPESAAPLFDLSVITPDGRPVKSLTQMEIVPHSGTTGIAPPDILIIPVIFGDLDPVLSDTTLITRLREWHRSGTVVCAVCAGVFLAARTGLLDGRRATTHWHLADEFRRRFPDVILKQEKMLVDEGDFVTAGGVTAYMDLCLYLAQRYGSVELASVVSKALLIDPVRRAQTPYARFQGRKVHDDEAILKVQEWLETHFPEALTLDSLARIAGLSQRTFARRFKKAVGDTPLEYLQALRISKARTLLETTADPIDAVTWAVGYEDVSSFRRLFKRVTGLSPTAYRRKFSLYRA